ncbi:MAG: hypothetical protein A3D67_00230 [Candidatus Lloydbacteria bacterium RIFCSPHIGHO2_02_FULL_51_22]|uniref:Uncharacterized protein n=2 Tax=Candidatus Lloydiibacteriota TaxID=1817910 RepID=A0A1G2DFK4_9BACT|nr:MAG: hypothetical protein A3D67_00230 [Candidatus Lloydbacteria bacterium RIFCSPHIGHO2_02_FULL_51_22]OGZ15715.1 MAG: hypothetical protein A3J08_02510 [Candidatus Lloydbacteria bacterium RIFCSPLOWO2_02_FULL_51_11]
MAKREVEGEEYRDISSPNRSVTAKNRVLCEPEWNFEIGSSMPYTVCRIKIKKASFSMAL